MKSGLFVSHKGQRCGVYQYGLRVFNALKHGKRINWRYMECSGIDELGAILATDKPDILVLNYHPDTLAWGANSRLLNYGAVVFCIFHEAHQTAADQAKATFFDFLLCPDPTLVPRNPIIVSVPRMTIDCKVVDVAPPELFTVGSFGFATSGKGFDRLCAQVNAEFDHARIRMNIPPHDNEDLVPREYTDALVESCRRAVTKAGIDLVISHDFLDDSALLRFLAGNTINAFLYEDQTGRGIASCVDYAVASGRPLAVSKSTMFRHLYEVNPSICVDDSSLTAIAARDGEELAPLRAAYSFENAGQAWEKAILAALDQLAISRSVPDGRGFNKILDERSRQAYSTALNLLKLHAPATLGRKIEKANIQQAFALDTALRLLPAARFSRILAIGSFEDTAVATLKSMGYRVDEIDPNVNGTDLEMFYRSPSSRIGGYDLILCVSVLEQVPDDLTFMRMTADLLAPEGVGVFTVDFAQGYADGGKRPLADERLYTTADICERLMSTMPDCALLDVPTWQQGIEDFEYEGCHYGFAGWVFRKFREETLRRLHYDGAWKQLLANTAAELAAAKGLDSFSDIQDLLRRFAADGVQSHVIPKELDDIYRRLVYDLRFNGGSRNLQFGLKVARLVRKISWKIRPSLRRKAAAKKTAAEAVSRNGQRCLGASPIIHESNVQAFVDRLESVLITAAVDRRGRRRSEYETQAASEN